MQENWPSKLFTDVQSARYGIPSAIPPSQRAISSGDLTPGDELAVDCYTVGEHVVTYHELVLTGGRVLLTSTDDPTLREGALAVPYGCGSEDGSAVETDHFFRAPIQRIYRAQGPSGAYVDLDSNIGIAGNWDASGGTDLGYVSGSNFYLGLERQPGVESTWKRLSYGNGITHGQRWTRGRYLSTDVPVTGDWNGDGMTDIGVVRGNQFLRGIVAADGVHSLPALTFGHGMPAGDIPITGDWNGDGRTDFGVVRGNSFILGTEVAPGVARTDRTQIYGHGLASGDIPIAGDWNGDGMTDIGVTRLIPDGTGVVYKRFVLGVLAADGHVHTYATLNYNPHFATSDQPLIGDWNGDGKDEPALIAGENVYLTAVSGSSIRTWKRLAFGNGMRATVCYPAGCPVFTE